MLGPGGLGEADLRGTQSPPPPPRETWCSPHASGGHQFTLEAGTEVAEVCKWVLALRLGLAGRKARRSRLVSRTEEGAWRKAGASEPTYWSGTASAPAHMLKASLGTVTSRGRRPHTYSGAAPEASLGLSPDSPYRPSGPAPPPLRTHPKCECVFPCSPLTLSTVLPQLLGH